MNINQNYLTLHDDYLFHAITKKVADHAAARPAGADNPGAKIIRLGIGDVTRPLPPAVVEAMEKAVRELGAAATFRGYGDYEGYPFLRHAIGGYYAKKSVEVSEDEIFVSDGAKSDLGNILDIFAPENTVLISDPVYPAYVDANIMAGREIKYLVGHSANAFLPLPDQDTRADIIYLCSPNNPTGAVYGREQLQLWVAHALENDAVILFDSAYEAFIRDGDLPTSIYQIDGAKECAIEFCSFSKTAGFTGTRCGYTVVPHALKRGGVSLNKLWLRRQATKYNGAPYIVQRGAEAVFSDAGQAQVKENIDYYMENARLMTEALGRLGIWHTGGQNAPYVWLGCPEGYSSWEYFDHLLEKYNIVGTPGAGFGDCGEGYLRLSAFGAREDVVEAIRRLTCK